MIKLQLLSSKLKLLVFSILSAFLAIVSFVNQQILLMLLLLALNVLSMGEFIRRYQRDYRFMTQAQAERSSTSNIQHTPLIVARNNRPLSVLPPLE